MGKIVQQQQTDLISIAEIYNTLLTPVCEWVGDRGASDQWNVSAIQMNSVGKKRERGQTDSDPTWRRCLSSLSYELRRVGALKTLQREVLLDP